jgi:hypothetical protein
VLPENIRFIPQSCGCVLSGMARPVFSEGDIKYFENLDEIVTESPQKSPQSKMGGSC